MSRLQRTLAAPLVAVLLVALCFVFAGALVCAVAERCAK